MPGRNSKLTRHNPTGFPCLSTGCTSRLKCFPPVLVASVRTYLARCQRSCRGINLADVQHTSSAWLGEFATGRHGWEISLLGLWVCCLWVLFEGSEEGQKVSRGRAFSASVFSSPPVGSCDHGTSAERCLCKVRFHGNNQLYRVTQIWWLCKILEI